MRDPLDSFATPERLRVALEAAGASDPARLRAMARASATPDPRAWSRFLSAALLLLGAGLVLAGVISFFAFNWASLGRFARFGLIEAAVAACALVGWRSADRLSGRVALFAASVLVGPLLAVYGQAYQTGADPWGLFAAWAVLITPWVVAARFTALWVLVLTLVDVALVLFWQQVIEGGLVSWMAMFPAMATIHALAVCGWEWQRTRREPWLSEAWAPRLAVAAGFTMLLVPSTLVVAVFRQAGRPGIVSLAGLVAAAAAVLWFYRLGRRDLFMLTVVAGAGFVMVSVMVGRVLLVEVPLGLIGPLLMAIFIIGEIGLAAAWLRRTLREWETS
jgi:uncharacterized membrane protein